MDDDEKEKEKEKEQESSKDTGEISLSVPQLLIGKILKNFICAFWPKVTEYVILILWIADKDDPSLKSSAIRTRKKREHRRPTGKISPEDIVVSICVPVRFGPARAVYKMCTA